MSWLATATADQNTPEYDCGLSCKMVADSESSGSRPPLVVLEMLVVDYVKPTPTNPQSIQECGFHKAGIQDTRMRVSIEIIGGSTRTVPCA